MSTLLLRDPGPDKRIEMSDNSADRLDRGEKTGLPQRKGGRRRAWVPGIASLLCLLIGLSDVLAIFKPAWHARLHNVNAFVPGTLTNVTRSADVIIGLMLVLLAHGLRRRKRRAWQAVLALLVFDIVIHFLHFPRDPRPYSAVVAIVLLAVLLFFHEDFYALGDPRTRVERAAGLRGSWSSRTWPSGSATLPWDRWTAATRSLSGYRTWCTSSSASTVPCSGHPTRAATCTTC